MAERQEQVPERIEVRIGFDRLLWKLSVRWMEGLENTKTFKQLDSRLVPPRLNRRPEYGDVDIGRLNRAILSIPNSGGSEKSPNIVQILDVGARTKYLPALLLVFVANDQSAIRGSFVVDEHHSADHDRAFADVGGLDRMGIDLADRALAHGVTGLNLSLI